MENKTKVDGKSKGRKNIWEDVPVPFIAAAFVLIGVILYKFPDFVVLPPRLTWPFHVIGYMFYVLALVVLVPTAEAAASSAFVIGALLGGGSLVGALAMYFFNKSKEHQGKLLFTWGLPVFLLLSAAAFFLSLGVGSLFTHHLGPASPGATVDQQPRHVISDKPDPQVISEQAPEDHGGIDVENIAKIIVAVAGVIAALVPIIKLWFNIK